MRIFLKIYSAISYILKRLLGLTEFFLFLRLLLKFLRANPKTPVVNLIYKGSEILISPFKSIFPDIYWQGRIVEIVTLSAMIGYALVIYFFFQLIKSAFKE